MSNKIIKEIPYDKFSKAFEYSTDSHSYLIMKTSDNNFSRIGKPCGYLSKDGYWCVKYKGVNYQAARVIYCLFNRSIDTLKVVDHIDQNRQNNRIENLRLVTIKENNRNKTKHKSNKTSATGVTYLEVFNRVDKYNRYYRAAINNDLGKTTVKSFNIEKYGEALAFELACNFREETLKSRDYYTERHGK